MFSCVSRTIQSSLTPNNFKILKYLCKFHNIELFESVNGQITSRRSRVIDSIFGYASVKKQRIASFCTKTDAVNGLLNGSPENFVNNLIERDISRCCFVQDDNGDSPLVSSHDDLAGLEEFINTFSTEYSPHEGIFLHVGRRSQCLLGAFLSRTDRGQACGGIRLQKYKTLKEFLDDGLRLSYCMGVKAALADVWFSGGQGIIAAPKDNRHFEPDFRENLLLDYGDFLTSLNGCFIGAEDLGVTVSDLNVIRNRSRYVLGISEDKGGSGNPALATGRGVVCAMEGALDYLELGDLNGKHVVVQGAGNVGVSVIHELLNKGVNYITASECHQKRVDDIVRGFAKKPESAERLQVVKVDLDDVSALTIPCDILAPCANGNVLTEKNIPLLEARIVCGAANNQLEHVSDNRLLVERGVTFVVDFVASRMGLVQVCSEMYGRLADDPAIESHFDKQNKDGIYARTKAILALADAEGLTPLEAARKLAAAFAQQPHPMFPGRTRLITRSLLAQGWHRGRDYWRRRVNFVHGALVSP